MEDRKLKVFNNLTRKKDFFKPITPGKVKFYSCGPTTYDFLHVGNAMALVVGDIMHRSLEALGHEVLFVRNFTDVDDKIIERAKSLGVDPLEHSDKFVKECQKDMLSLGMKPADKTPKVSETIPEIVEMIETLVDKGFAYVVKGEVLYHVPKFKDYGKLSKKDLDSLEHGRRVEVESHKKHPSDFVLWKPAKEGEPYWESPWGKGRPGWHIECSAMSKKFLGDNFDLHHGGVDLMFPHHENEIAQSEAANGKAFSNHWCHNEFLNFGHEKMSKSLGNVVTIRKFVETFSGEILRMILISGHYRSNILWTDEAIMKGVQDVQRLAKFQLNLEEAKAHNFELGAKAWPESTVIIDEMKDNLANDFNVPGALSNIYLFIRKMNQGFLDETGLFKGKDKLSEGTYKECLEIIDFTKESLGCFYGNPGSILKQCQGAIKNLKGSEEKLSSDEIEKLIQERKEARSHKKFARADEIRDLFKKEGVKVKDNPDGTSSWEYE